MVPVHRLDYETANHDRIQNYDLYYLLLKTVYHPTIHCFINIDITVMGLGSALTTGCSINHGAMRQYYFIIVLKIHKQYSLFI